MVSLERVSNHPYRAVCGTVPMETTITRFKNLPDAFINSDGSEVTQKFYDYLSPLIEPLGDYADFDE